MNSFAAQQHPLVLVISIFALIFFNLIMMKRRRRRRIWTRMMLVTNI
jgi:hypothetical protein